jgi:SOS-response transcriptional repressor LexA
MTGLTDNQAWVLLFLEPNPARSLAEICHKFGWASTNSARDILKALERKGFVKLNPKIHRGIEVLRGVPSTIRERME